MGLISDVYKHNGQDASNGGLSHFFNEVTAVNIPGPFEPTPQRPAVLLVRGNIHGTVKVVPVRERIPDLIGPMAGGCYVGTSDGRFGEAIEQLLGRPFYGAVSLHDRFETPEQYRALSD